MTSKTSNALIYFAYLMLAWGAYRLVAVLPAAFEELVLKPAVWLIPVFYLLSREKEKVSSIGITGKNLFPSFYLSIFLGAVFAVVGLLANFGKYGEVIFAANIGGEFVDLFFLSLVAAAVEEIAFRGYIFTRLSQGLSSPWAGAVLSSMFWALIFVPVNIFVVGLGAEALALQFLLMFVFGLGSSFVFYRTGNVLSSILLHLLWIWPVILFR